MQLALEQRLADQPEVEVLQVAQPAVDELARARRRAARVVALLHQRDRVAAARGVERDPGAGDPAADDQHVERLVGQRGEGVVARRPSGQVRRRPRRAGPARAPASRPAPGRGAAARASPRRRGSRRPRGPRACAGRRACASSRRARGRGRRAGRCSTRTRRRRGPPRRSSGSPARTTDAATSVGARSSLAAASGPAAALSRSSASGPRTRKRHGFVRLWFGAQRASSNSSSSVARSTGSGAYALCVRRERISSGRSTGARG